MIGDRLRKARLERGLTQRGLAWALGISQEHMNRIERGHVSPGRKVLSAIARHLPELRGPVWDELLTPVHQHNYPSGQVLENPDGDRKPE